MTCRLDEEGRGERKAKNARCMTPIVRVLGRVWGMVQVSEDVDEKTKTDRALRTLVPLSPLDFCHV